MDSVPNSFLEAGLLALEQGDYSAAIAHLEAVCQQELERPLSQVRAQVGLVAAYEHTGEISRALALCQTLSQSNDPQVREWAICHQTELLKRSTTDITGFVAEALKRGKSSSRGVRDLSPGMSSLFDGWTIYSTFHLPSRRQAGRAKRWQPLPTVNLIPLKLLQVGTAIAMFWLIRELLQFTMAFTNDLLVKLPYLEPFQPFYGDPTQFVIVTLVILMGLSPWLLDGLNRLFHGLQPLSINALSTYSPEAIRLIQRYCHRRRWQTPNLGILPTLAPVALTYGNLPRTARIVVSKGLLEQMTDDEIATIYAAQLGHIAHWDFVVMSLALVVTQLPYTIYWQVSQWGDRSSNSIWRGTAAALATLSYGVWWLLKIPAVWLSQIRIYYSDRFATEITGNPNALTRALLKIATGIAEDIKKQGYTSWLLESWNLLTTLGYQQSITLGSLCIEGAHALEQGVREVGGAPGEEQLGTTLETLLAWDLINPYRYWLNINNTHPLIGERLLRLSRIAHHWHLETELNLLKKGAGSREQRAGGVEGVSPLTLNSIPAPSALLPAPFLGIGLGFGLGGLLWMLGVIGIWLQIAQLAWMYGDWSLIKSCLLIGFSIGTFLQINFFFPDIKSATVQTNPSLPHLLANPTALPINSQFWRLQGKLLGRTGIGNWLGQDLILLSQTGLVKLHYISCLGYVGNFLAIHSPRPSELVGRHLIATGWFRRGSTPMLDIETLRTQSGLSSPGGHPIWSTFVAIAAAVWGVCIILWGGA